MNSHELSDASNQILKHWGFEADIASEAPRIVVFDAAFLERWAQDLNLLNVLVTRLARSGVLSIGQAASRFTHGAGKRSNLTTSPFIGRPDFVFRNGQPKLLELNADSSVGGLFEISTLAQLYKSTDCLPKSLQFRSPMESFAQYLDKIPACRDQLVLLLSSRSFSAYYRDIEVKMAAELSAALARDCIVAYVDDLTIGDYVKYDGREVSIVVKLDTMIDESNYSEFAEFLKKSIRTKSTFVSDNIYINVEDKASIALLLNWVSQHPSLVSDPEKEAVERLTVPTWLLRDHEPGNGADWSVELRQSKNRYVLKRAFSFGGAQVIAGPYASKEAWERAVAIALKDPGLWVVQEFIESDRILFANGRGRLVAAQGAEGGERCVISPYIFDRDIGGFLCRTIRSETDAVIGLRSPAKMGLYIVAEEERTP